MATTVADVINNEYNRLASKKLEVDTAISGQQRAVLLNESYKKRFSKYTQIVMIISFTILIYLGILVFKKTFFIIPEWILDVIFGLILFGAFLYCIFIAQEIATRNITNYDELHLPPYVEDPAQKNDKMTTLEEIVENSTPNDTPKNKSLDVMVENVSKSSEQLTGVSINNAFALITK